MDGKIDETWVVLAILDHLIIQFQLVLSGRVVRDENRI